MQMTLLGLSHFIQQIHCASFSKVLQEESNATKNHFLVDCLS